MKFSLPVCLVASTVTAIALHSAVMQATMDARRLQKGVSVEMAITNHAQAWPQADDNDAWVVTIDNTGRLYFGSDLMTEEELRRWMIRHPRRRDQKLYIKTDARAPYARVQKALDAASTAEFTEPVLLVSQSDGSAKPGIVVPPKGLEVAINDANQYQQAVVVEIMASEKGPTTLTINHEDISWDSLPDRLHELLQNGNEKSVLVQPDGQAAFADVARVIDACAAVPAKAVLTTAGL